MAHSIASIVIAGFLAASVAYWLVAWWCTRRFFRQARRPVSDFSALISFLKPIKGLDAHAAENFASFCRQDYPDYEILFGIADERDPAAALVRDLQREFPDGTIRLIAAPSLGANPKSATLEELAAEANGEVLVISDSDVRVSERYLREVIAPLADESVGLVTCPYVGAEPRGLAARLERLHMDVVFLPSAILAHELLHNCVGMGATLALRKETLGRLGGYRAFADHLMDDYQLAWRVRELGLKTVISRHTVRSVLGPTRFGEQWAREVRWARGIRVTSPAKYPGLLITYLTIWAAALVAVRPLHASSWIAFVVALFFRVAIAWDLSGVLGERDVRWDLWMLPIRECLSFAVWCAGAAGRTVLWRGQRFRLHKDGTLEQMPQMRSNLISRAVRWLDRALRRRQGIFSYSEDPQCIFRLSIARAPRDIQLSDGVTLRAGDVIADLHFYNEHLPPIPEGGTGLAWAIQMHGLIRRSMEQLAEAAGRDARLMDVIAFRGQTVFTPKGGFTQIQRFLKRLHFEPHEAPKRRSLFQRLHDRGENILIWALLRTFNPGGLRTAKFSRERHEFWISRKAVREHYGQDGAEGVAATTLDCPLSAPQ